MKGELLNIEYRPTNGILYCVWSSETETAQWKSMQAAMFNYVEAIVEKSAQYVLVDERQLNFIWTPTNQEWVDEFIFARVLKTNIKKLAIIQSSEIFIAVAVEQMMQEKNGQNLNQKFFDSFEQAEQWLLS